MFNSDPKAIYKNLTLVYWLLFLTMVSFLIIASLVVSNIGPMMGQDPLIHQILKLLVIGFTVVIIPLAHSVPQRMIKKIGPEATLSEKIGKYQQALIIRFALTEGVAFFAIVAFLFTGDNDLILILAIILLFFVISRPNNFKTSHDLGLTELEKKQMFVETAT
jgi:hypothetical protein